MKISLITISRDKATGLQRTIASVRAQLVDPDVEVEHIIVDGCSTDGSDSVLKAAENQSVVIRREPHGIYDALNTGIAAATGDVIGMLHGGDVFTDSTVLQHVADAFRAQDAPDYIFGDIHYLSRKGRPKRRFCGEKASRQSLLCGFQPPHPSIYIKADAQRALGLYSTNYRIAADYEMILKIFFSDNLRGRYIPYDMVAMEPGGLATRLSSRLWINNYERIKALKTLGLPASWRSLIHHYLYLFRLK